MNPSWRTLVGTLLILLLIAAWSVVVVAASGPVLRMAWPVQLLFFLVAGIAWILPLKPLVRWMQTGKWRE